MRLICSFLLILMMGCGPSDAELEARRSLTDTLDMTEQELRETRADRDAWKERAESYWNRARQEIQSPHRVDAPKLTELRSRGRDGGMAESQITPHKQSSVRLPHPGYLELTAQHGTEDGRVIGWDRCTFMHNDGLVFSAYRTTGPSMPEHPDGPQTLNANTLVGLDEAVFWQKTCKGYVEEVLNN